MKIQNFFKRTYFKNLILVFIVIICLTISQISLWFLPLLFVAGGILGRLASKATLWDEHIEQTQTFHITLFDNLEKALRNHNSIGNFDIDNTENKSNTKH